MSISESIDGGVLQLDFLSVVKEVLQQNDILTRFFCRRKQTISSSHLKKYFFLFGSGLVLSLSACGSYMDASLEEINKTVMPAEPLNLKNPQFFVGEVVTTTNGSVVKGVFGETSERKVLSNNVVIEGAFYE